MDRRTFLGAAPAAAIAASEYVHASAARRADRTPLDAWGVQLYTLRREMADDPDRTLAAVARIGYRQVELAGLYGLTPSRMRAKLDAVGLDAVSSHSSLRDAREDWVRFLDGARELGQALVVVPGIPAGERSADGLRRVADDLNGAAERARAVGLRFGYHNHDWEMRPLPDGTVPIDLLLERTEAELVDWQMDIFWTVHGGRDPAEYLKATAGRVTSVHVKDRTADGRMVDVGDGVIDFATLLRQAERLGLRHAIVEHDRPDDAVQSVRRSFAHLSALAI